MNIHLQNTLSRQLKTLQEVNTAFDYCVTISDIHEVISRIPERFGKFKVLDTAEDYTYFVIQNLVKENEREYSHVCTHDFYKGGFKK